MPRFDRTGPLGQGPTTGRGLGPCGAGRGYGRGMGRGFGRRFSGIGNYSVTSKEEKTMLQEEAEVLEDELKAIKARISELKD